jgi:lysophospholipase L1-like esterase
LTGKTNGRIHLVNDSADGRTTGFDKKELNACFCLNRRLAKYGPLDNVFIMLGTNDVKQRYGPPSAFEITRNLTTMVELIVRHHTNIQPVFLLPPPIGKDLVDDFNRADERIHQVCTVIRNFCAERKLHVIDTHSVLDISQHLKTDSVHLNAKGRQVVADVVHGYLCGYGTAVSSLYNP